MNFWVVFNLMEQLWTLGVALCFLLRYARSTQWNWCFCLLQPLGFFIFTLGVTLAFEMAPQRYLRLDAVQECPHVGTHWSLQPGLFGDLRQCCSQLRVYNWALERVPNPWFGCSMVHLRLCSVPQCLWAQDHWARIKICCGKFSASKERIEIKKLNKPTPPPLKKK